MARLIPLKKWAFILFIVGSGLTGCQKMNDYVHFPFKGDTEFKLCDIRNVTVRFSTSLQDYVVHYAFTYDKHGNPVSIKNDFVGTGNPNVVFKYDKNGRLTEMIRPYEAGNGSFETWNKFGYNNRNQIVRDTLYTFGSYIDSVPALTEYSGTRFYTSYEYDPQGRISSRTDSVYVFSQFIVANHFVYTYDSRGNLINGATYDDKVSILRTNKIWMFLNRNYSINNSFPVIKYNSYGLPETFQSVYETLGNIVPDSGTDEVEYSCH